MALPRYTMKAYKRLYQDICSEQNLALAFKKARKRKSLKPYVIEFEANLQDNLYLLRQELISGLYKPKPLQTFIIRDPKTRKISKSDFKDRIVHHAICNILEPIFDKNFIYDSFANRKGKGTLKALKRFDHFKSKVSRNNTRACFVLKADIKHYFDEVNHDVLLSILQRKIKDEQLISLIIKVLKNHSDKVGMPIGNMTSQFFANVYLNELDQYVKHELRAKHYIRYVDDFVILSNDRVYLESCKGRVDQFLKKKLMLELHTTKSKIIKLSEGVPFLGFRNFPFHRLLRKANILNAKRQLSNPDYDNLCKYLEGWTSYSMHANTYSLRNKIAATVETLFPGKISLLRISRIHYYDE